MQTTTERPARFAGELYFPTDISPDQVFEAIGRLRKEAQDEIDRLLAFLDETDGYSTTEQEINGDDEPSLGFQVGDTFVGRGCESGGSGDDCEVEDEHDEDTCDREDDPADGPEEVNEDGDGNPDDEPSLGWTVDGVISNSDGVDREADGSYLTEAARQRYQSSDRYGRNADGKHVNAERGFSRVARRLTNLSDQQRAAVAPRLNHEEVRI